MKINTEQNIHFLYLSINLIHHPEEYRKKNIGKLTIKYITNLAIDQNNVKDILLNVDSTKRSLINFYKKCGFSIHENIIMIKLATIEGEREENNITNKYTSNIQSEILSQIRHIGNIRFNILGVFLL